MAFLRMWNGLGGTVHGSFFRVADEVDTREPPGATPLECPTTALEAFWGIASGQAFFFSPNVTWFLIACLVWWSAPYRLDGGGSLTFWDQFQERLVVHHVLVFVYVGFWHTALYWWDWGERPFVKSRQYQWGKVSHNAFYTWLGVWQWAATEAAIIVYGYQTGAISYREDSLSWNNNPKLLLQTLLICILLPNIRDVHFYFAHRLIHTRFLYQYIHSLHHRNTDIEPFSGLCMHPIEHMYYFTCYGICLLLPTLGWSLHPIVLCWMGVHILISPAASHSGYEDHFSADLAHYLHHRYADCNYGVPQSIPFDQWFGTFRDQWKQQPLSVVDKASTSRTVDPKARLGWYPDHPRFNALWMSLWWVIWHYHHQIPPIVGALGVSLGPALIAYALAAGKASRTSPSKLSPFDKDPIGSQLLHFGLGLGLGVLPATFLVYFVLQQSQQQDPMTVSG